MHKAVEHFTEAYNKLLSIRRRHLSLEEKMRELESDPRVRRYIAYMRADQHLEDQGKHYQREIMFTAENFMKEVTREGR